VTSPHLALGVHLTSRGAALAISDHVHSKPVLSYALALLIFGAAVLLRIALDYVLPERLPFVTFFPAVVLSAYWCGLGPGVLVLVLSGAVGALWGSPLNGPFTRLLSFGLFLIVTGLPVALIQSLLGALARLRQHEEQTELINRELKHRIKNLFVITNAICLQTIRSGGPVEEMSRAVSGRIMAIAAAQDVLGAAATEGADLGELVRALVASLAPHASRLKVSGPRTRLPAEATTPFALILHELGTNALKYGAWSAERGYVAITWTVENETLRFVWREHGGPAVAPPPREGLGSALIKQGLPSASVQHDLKADGLECNISLPGVRVHP
jgi:two-component sensor histidine kinase